MTFPGRAHSLKSSTDDTVSFLILKVISVFCREVEATERPKEEKKHCILALNHCQHFQMVPATHFGIFMNIYIDSNFQMYIVLKQS